MNASFLYIDSAVNNVQRYTPDDLPIVIDSRGGGGTSFEPAFEWVEEHNEESYTVCISNRYVSVLFLSMSQIIL